MLKAEELLEKWEKTCKRTRDLDTPSAVCDQANLGNELAALIRELAERCDACPRMNQLAGQAMELGQGKEFAEHKLRLAEERIKGLEERLNDTTEERDHDAYRAHEAESKAEELSRKLRYKEQSIQDLENDKDNLERRVRELVRDIEDEKRKVRDLEHDVREAQRAANSRGHW